MTTEWGPDSDMEIGMWMRAQLDAATFHGDGGNADESMRDRVIRTCLTQLMLPATSLSIPGWSTEGCSLLPGVAAESVCPLVQVTQYPGWYVCLHHMTAHECTLETCRFIDLVDENSYVCRVTHNVLEASISVASGYHTKVNRPAAEEDINELVEYGIDVDGVGNIDDTRFDDPDDPPNPYFTDDLLDPHHAAEVPNPPAPPVPAADPKSPFKWRDPPATFVEAVRCMLRPPHVSGRSGFAPDIIHAAESSMTSLRVIHVARCIYKLVKLLYPQIMVMSPASTLLIYMHAIITYMQGVIPSEWRKLDEVIIPTVYGARVLASRHTDIQLHHSTQAAKQLIQIVKNASPELLETIDAIWTTRPTVPYH